MSLHYTPVSQGLVFTCFEGRCLKQLRNFMGILSTDIWLRLQLWLLVMTDLSKLSYLVSGLKLTFIPWSKSTFALTYLTAKLKKKSKNKISHWCQSHHLSFCKELFRSFSLFFWWICFGFLLHSHFLGLRCQYVKCFVQENHKGIKLAQGYNIQPSLNLCTLETQGQHIFMPVAWNICSLFFN